MVGEPASELGGDARPCCLSVTGLVHHDFGLQCLKNRLAVFVAQTNIRLAWGPASLDIGDHTALPGPIRILALHNHSPVHQSLHRQRRHGSRQPVTSRNSTLRNLRQCDNHVRLEAAA